MSYRNALIIKPGAIGDLLQLTPILRALNKAFPGMKVSLLVGSPAAGEMFKYNPNVHEIVVFDRKGAHRSFSAFLALWWRVRGAGYDLVINYQRSNLKAWLLALAAAPCRVLIYHKARRRIVHAVVNHLETLAPLGIVATDCHLDLFLGAEDERFAEQVFAEAGLYGQTVIALNPGASHRVNRWGTKQFAELIDLLNDQLDVRSIIVGGSGDETLAAEIAAAARSNALVLAGKTTIRQLGAVLKRCAVLVSGDTGPMHVATAVGTRVVALFGAADPERTGPVGPGHRVIQATTVHCVPCRRRTCDNVVELECMNTLAAETVLDTIVTILHER
jgi:ADP-heptose:LPS heptosyltransferase